MKNQIQLYLKKRIKDVEGEKLAKAALDFLSIETGAVKTGKIFNVLYDLKTLEIEKFANQGLCDEVIHDVFINTYYQNEMFKTFILVAKMPGVTDDEGVSAQKTLNDILELDLDVNTQHIYTENIYLFENDLNNEELKKLAEDLLGNKLIHHFEFGKFEGKVEYIPEVKIAEGKPVEFIDVFIADENLMELSKEMLLSLNLEEMNAIKEYYAKESVQAERKALGLPVMPTDVEMEVLAQTWSEHCKHKEFAASINYKNNETGEEKTIDSLFKSYIRKSTEIVRERLEKAGNNWLLKIFTDNAGVVRIDDDSVFVWKVETHNSPSAIDPYGGAITGILGNNRDPLATGIGGAKLLFNT
ncbi:MAG: phosphoribosylformylglycinamidine synthase, partial [Candidatus Cloacimonetes bacterium]|nr:phosphoribosylformylglycinamidine synthase [Candidatus Cloacimonadota bacterium]